MPSKSRGKRAASRQAQLSGRRRRRGGRARGATATATGEQPQIQEVRRQARPSSPAVDVASPETSVAAQAAAAPATTARRRSSRARTPVEPLQMYPYLGSELRRIGALSVLVAITLAVLTVVLG